MIDFTLGAFASIRVHSWLKFFILKPIAWKVNYYQAS